MNITLTSFQLQKLLSDASELGALKALAKVGTIKPYLKKSEAFRRFGRKNVEQWISQGLKRWKSLSCMANRQNRNRNHLQG